MRDLNSTDLSGENLVGVNLQGGEDRVEALNHKQFREKSFFIKLLDRQIKVVYIKSINNERGKDSDTIRRLLQRAVPHRERRSLLKMVVK